MLSAFSHYLYSLHVNKLHYKENTIYILKATVIAFIINLFVNLLLIPPYEQKGAAIATFIGYFSLYYFIKKYGDADERI